MRGESFPNSHIGLYRKLRSGFYRFENVNRSCVHGIEGLRQIMSRDTLVRAKLLVVYLSSCSCAVEVSLEGPQHSLLYKARWAKQGMWCRHNESLMPYIRRSPHTFNISGNDVEKCQKKKIWPFWELRRSLSIIRQKKVIWMPFCF